MIKVISNQESNEIQQAQTKRDMKLKATLNSFKVDPFGVKQVMNAVPITNRMYRELEKAKEKERKKKLQEIQVAQINQQLNAQHQRDDLEL
ncbi:MAG: hypothetical protein SPG88_13780 [Enterococcus hirae]|nr:hypothetical protein [Methanobrevibacter smithii]MCI6883371.1 hypothetical protein [Lactobacillus johnsonii]MDD7245187.1 hypothetical protein [Methanobrevibacter smithii]MDY5311120.1 hypothetical protein [Enterococcus hirae]